MTPSFLHFLFGMLCNSIFIVSHSYLPYLLSILHCFAILSTWVLFYLFRAFIFRFIKHRESFDFLALIILHFSKSSKLQRCNCWFSTWLPAVNTINHHYVFSLNPISFIPRSWEVENNFRMKLKQSFFVLIFMKSKVI